MDIWDKRDDMVVHRTDPYNAEPPPRALADRTLTPLDAFYSRNHGPIPDLDPASGRGPAYADTSWARIRVTCHS
jgi:sulfite oxidase